MKLRRLFYLLFPGVVVHELLHVGAVRLFGGSFSIDWSVPNVSYELPERMPLQAMIVNFAPVLVGVPVLVPLAAFVASRMSLTSIGELVALWWLLVNVFVVVLPSLSDLLAGVRVLSFWRNSTHS